MFLFCHLSEVYPEQMGSCNEKWKDAETMAGFSLHSFFSFIVKTFLLDPSLALDLADPPFLMEAHLFFP